MLTHDKVLLVSAEEGEDWSQLFLCNMLFPQVILVALVSEQIREENERRKR